jgi:predicted enzyme related to lactoylglutathione lyase
MSVVEKHTPGSFCWAELGTTDAKAAKAFYGSLFGWQPNDMPLGPDQFYTMLQIEGKEIGALYELEEDMRRMGILPHWLQYIIVASADEAAARVKALGGTVMKEPFDVFDAGRMAVVQDPTRAVFALWQANRSIGARITGVPGTLCWSELITSDKSAAIEFYTKLFGWTTKTNLSDPNQYTEISNQGRPMGGMMQMSKDWGSDTPAHWMGYFLVADCDASAARIKELGGSVKMPAMDIPNVGRFAVVTDPQEAVFAIFQPAAH